MTLAENENNNVAKLENDYAREQTRKYQEQHRQVVFRRRRLAFVLTIAFAVFVCVGLQLFRDYQRLQNLKSIRVEAVADRQVVRDNVSQLKQDVSLLKDEDYVAKVARARFYYSKDDEHVYPIPEDNTAKDKQEQKVEKAIDNNMSSTAE